MLKRSSVAAMVVLLSAVVSLAILAGSQAQEASPAKDMKAEERLQEQLIAIEKKIWKAFAGQDAKGFQALVAEDGWSIDAFGIMGMKETVQSMADWEIEDYSLEGFRTIALGKDAAILIYTVHATASFKDESLPETPIYVSTTYVNRGGKWTPVFHQETIAMEEPSADE